MKNKLNQNGFTLIELLAVLVILGLIMGITIPSISSSIEKTKTNQNKSRYKIIESAMEQYVTDHKNAIYSKMADHESCYLKVSDITLLSTTEMEDASGKDLSNYYVVYTKPSKFNFIEDGSKGDAIISCI